ncbi:MAG: hypothetical protein GPJ54_13635 [Candidatus Heimdallarchaeota archaeon]|nr:hypothetical protein [Candidatus Heimdallarchaeota archaeon]
MTENHDAFPSINNSIEGNKRKPSVHFIRKLHLMKNKYSQFTRFTVPKRLIMMFEEDKLRDSIISLSLNDNRERVEIRLLDKNRIDFFLLKSYTRSLIDNHDGSYRVTLPDECIEVMTDLDEKKIVGLKLIDKEILFEIYH